MTVVGLTGQSGAGKTAAGKIFAEHGFRVIDADIAAREVMKKGGECLKETIDHFGTEFLTPDGELDRRKLAEKVFSDKESLSELERITYPHINRRVEHLIEKFRNEGAKLVLLDAPTLFEAGEEKLCDCIAAVTADESVRKERVMLRDGISRESAEKRFKSQRTADFFRKHADYIIDNSGSEAELIKRTKEIINIITETYHE